MAFEISDILQGTVSISFLPSLDTLSDVVRDSRKIHNQIAELIAMTDKDVWCIYDFSKIDVQFDDLAMVFIDQRCPHLSSIADPRVRVVGVIHNPAMANSISAFMDHYGWEMPLFERFDEAMDYIDQQNEVEQMLEILYLV
jgi:hypothetical protein